MKLSTKGIYGMIAMLELALQDKTGIVSLKSIAERQALSESYLEQLFVPLRKSGIIQSVRGAQGGYRLADIPGKITVGMILRSLEGSLAPVQCVAENVPPECDRFGECVTRAVWDKIRNALYDVIDAITLEDLVREYNNNNQYGESMYYI